MRNSLTGFVCGVVALHQLPELPGIATFAGLIVAGLLLLPAARTRPGVGLIAAALLGFAYAGWQASYALAHRLPTALEGETLRVHGRVSGLPRHDGYRSVFRFTTERFGGRVSGHPPRILRLSWYGAPAGLAPGQRWTLDVRLKRPRGLMNPGSFDYERWLFAHGIDAVGYVRGRAVLHPADESLDAARQAIASRLETLTGSGDGQAVLRALAVADRRDIRPALWSVFNATGTGHLLAISGLHIGLAAGLGAFLTVIGWRRSAALCRLAPPRAAGAAVGIVAALGYALLAGLGLPTQRALVMTGVASLALVLRRDWRAVDVFLWAAGAVLVADPLAPLGAGFWLSFWAVAVLLLAASSSGRGRWVRAQLAVSCGLFPLLALWFAALPWVSPLANAVAVPVVSLLVVPLTFAGLGAMVLDPALAAWLLGLAVQILDGLLAGLSWLAANTTTWPIPRLPAWLLASAATGLLILLVPGRWPGRTLGLTLILPLVVYQPPPLPYGSARLTVADAGQGTAVVVQTRNHVLIYDAGPRLGRTDAAEAAILPILRTRGLDHVDRLLVSHADSDHAGGAATLLGSRVSVANVLSGEPLERVASRPCRQGQQWRWDGVAFRVLHPTGDDTGNDASCVLQVRTSAGIVALLPGDISHRVERSLVRAHGGELRSDLLLVPHHGSDSSSSPAFIDAVAPREAVFTVGYRNRYGLPDADVVQRYLFAGAAVRVTSQTGALVFELDDRLRLRSRYRRVAGRYFRDG